MKIKKAHIQGFRNHSDTTLDFQDNSFVVIKGDNFSGKSSIAQAISMCLTPTTSGLDAQGRGFARKIKRGETKAVLTLDVQGGKHLVQQTVTLNTNTSGRTSKSTCLDDPDWKPLPFENMLTRLKDALMVALNTDYFVLRMGEKEQKKLLAQLALPERYDFPDETIKDVERLLGEGAIDFTGEPFAVIEKAYKKLFDERTVVNRQVKEFVVPDLLPLDPSIDSVGLEKEIEAIKAEQKKTQSACDAAVEAESKNERKRASLESKIETLRADVTAKKKEFDEVDKSILPDSEVQKLKQIATKKDEYETLLKEQSTNLVKVHTKDAEIKRLDEIPDAGSTCPTCDQVVDAERIKKMVGDLAEARHKYVKRNEEIATLLSKIGDVIAATAALDRNVDNLKRRDALRKEIEEKVTQGKSSRAELDALGEKKDPKAAFVPKIEELEHRLNAAQDKLRPVIVAEERKKEVKERKATLDNLKYKAGALDDLVKYFDKDGIKSKLLAEYIGGFEQKINEVISSWGYKCALSIDPYEFLVTNSRGDVVPVSELSGGEELMFSLALQCAVSRVSGINMIVADRMDTLLPEQRKRANGCLYGMAKDGTLEQAILVLADTNTGVPQLPGAAFFFVESGSVTRL